MSINHGGQPTDTQKDHNRLTIPPTKMKNFAKKKRLDNLSFIYTSKKQNHGYSHIS